jgi:hypothetical protein
VTGRSQNQQELRVAIEDCARAADPAVVAPRRDFDEPWARAIIKHVAAETVRNDRNPDKIISICQIP